MFFSAEFDPIRLVGQIILLQALFYFAYCSFLLISHLSISTPLHIALILSSKSITQQSWFGSILFLLASACIPFLISRVVMRTKLCLDFVTTLFGFHAVIIMVYDDAIPRSLYFWLLFILTLILVVISSEQLCMHFELSEIPLDFLSANTTKGSNKTGKSKQTSKSTPSPRPTNSNPTAKQAEIELITTAGSTAAFAQHQQHSSISSRTHITPQQSAQFQPSHNFPTGTGLGPAVYKQNSSFLSDFATDGDESDGDEADERKPMRPYR